MINALPIDVRQVGKGEIGAVQKAEPKVVVFQIKAVTVAWRLLIDEAKRTVVVALPQAIEERLREAKTQTIVSIFLQVHLMQNARHVAHLQVKLLINTEVAVIDEIPRANAVDAHQLITWLKSELLSDRPLLNLIHDRRLRLTGHGTGFDRRHRDAGGGLIPHRGQTFPSV